MSQKPDAKTPAWKCNSGDSLEELEKMLEAAQLEHYKAKAALLHAQLQLAPLQDDEQSKWMRLKNLECRRKIWMDAFGSK